MEFTKCFENTNYINVIYRYISTSFRHKEGHVTYYPCKPSVYNTPITCLTTCKSPKAFGVKGLRSLTLSSYISVIGQLQYGSIGQGPLHTQAKSRDLVMVMTLDSYPKAVPWVLGKSFQVVTDPQAQCEVRMDHVAGPLHILLAKKSGGDWVNIICLKSYQFETTIWWCLYVLESILEYVLESSLKFVLLKIFKKSWSLEICVRPTSWRQA